MESSIEQIENNFRVTALRMSEKLIYNDTFSTGPNKDIMKSTTEY
jgi:hypothetical protein